MGDQEAADLRQALSASKVEQPLPVQRAVSDAALSGHAIVRDISWRTLQSVEAAAGVDVDERHAHKLRRKKNYDIALQHTSSFERRLSKRITGRDSFDRRRKSAAENVARRATKRAYADVHGTKSAKKALPDEVQIDGRDNLKPGRSTSEAPAGQSSSDPNHDNVALVNSHRLGFSSLSHASSAQDTLARLLNELDRVEGLQSGRRHANQHSQQLAELLATAANEAPSEPTGGGGARDQPTARHVLGAPEAERASPRQAEGAEGRVERLLTYLDEAEERFSSTHQFPVAMKGMQSHSLGLVGEQDPVEVAMHAAAHAYRHPHIPDGAWHGHRTHTPPPWLPEALCAEQLHTLNLLPLTSLVDAVPPFAVHRTEYMCLYMLACLHGQTQPPPIPHADDEPTDLTELREELIEAVFLTNAGRLGKATARFLVWPSVMQPDEPASISSSA